jgi:hypothetical protein
MRAVVVYETHWGNTAAVAEAIAGAIGPDALALPVSQATPERLAGADLVVAGAPVWAFGLPHERNVEGMRKTSTGPLPDLRGPALRTWLTDLPHGQAHGRGAAFETRMRWTLGGATGAIERGLQAAGYAPLGRPARFVVRGTVGPLRDGELEKARAWGRALSRSIAEGAEGHGPKTADGSQAQEEA